MKSLWILLLLIGCGGETPLAFKDMPVEEPHLTGLGSHLSLTKSCIHENESSRYEIDIDIQTFDQATGEPVSAMVDVLVYSDYDKLRYRNPHTFLTDAEGHYMFKTFSINYDNKTINSTIYVDVTDHRRLELYGFNRSYQTLVSDQVSLENPCE